MKILRPLLSCRWLFWGAWFALVAGIVGCPGGVTNTACQSRFAAEGSCAGSPVDAVGLYGGFKKFVGLIYKSNEAEKPDIKGYANDVPELKGFYDFFWLDTFIGRFGPDSGQYFFSDGNMIAKSGPNSDDPYGLLFHPSSVDLDDPQLVATVGEIIWDGSVLMSKLTRSTNLVTAGMYQVTDARGEPRSLNLKSESFYPDGELQLATFIDLEGNELLEVTPRCLQGLPCAITSMFSHKFKYWPRPGSEPEEAVGVYQNNDGPQQP